MMPRKTALREKNLRPAFLSVQPRKNPLARASVGVECVGPVIVPRYTGLGFREIGCWQERIFSLLLLSRRKEEITTIERVNSVLCANVWCATVICSPCEEFS